MFSFCILQFAICNLLLLSGCASEEKPPTTQPVSIRERQDQALKDPMNYKVNPGRKERYDGMWDFDKEGFKKDMDHVFNP